jgi:hypothetical protein
VKHYIIHFIIFSFLIFFGCTNQERKSHNIKSFAKLYGYARWFHPSNESQEIDWDKFAVYGVKKVENLSTDSELKETLYDLFSPIIQGLEVYKNGEYKKIGNSETIPSLACEKKTTAWQHYGVRLNEKSNIYKSIRTNRPQVGQYSLLNKWLFDLSHFQGKEVKLSAFIRTQNGASKGNAYLYLVPVQYNEAAGSVSSIITNNMIKTDAIEWQEFEIKSKVLPRTSHLVLGCAAEGGINVWVDEIKLYVREKDSWTLVVLPNSGFESGSKNNDLSEWQYDESMHHISYSEVCPYSGKYSISFEYYGKMFDKIPVFGEFLNESIANNISCSFPISLVLQEPSTYPKINIDSFEKLKSEISEISISEDYNLYTNLASVVITWNVFQHFYPYFDSVKKNWAGVLSSTIDQTYNCKNRVEFTNTLKYLIAELNDGHGAVFGERMYHLPIRTEMVQGNIVVTGSIDSKIKIGDVILKVNGVKASDILYDMECLISGSPQLKRYRALNVFGSTYKPDNSRIIIDRKGEQIELDIEKIPLT